MLLIPTYVAPSRIEGVGVFAAEDVLEGTLIWRLDPRLDRLLSPEEIARMEAVHRAFIHRYGYPYPHDPSITVVELDNGRFMNHSTAPNTCFTDPDEGFTRTAIAAHEELTCDYSEFDPSFEMLPGRTFVAVG